MIMSNYDFLFDYEDSADVNNVFEDVLKAMMYSFGDVEEPLKESVDIVYHILRNEMNVLLTEAEEVALRKKKKRISHEDLLFLMRKNKGKLKRLLKYLQVMDDSPGLGKCSVMYFSGAKENGRKRSKKKRADICAHFLASIEDFGEYSSMLEDDTIIDVAHRNMLARRNAMTEWMSLDEYRQFTETVLRNSFCEKQMFKDFEKWLLEDKVIEMELTDLALEIVRFLARETVSKIVDLALLIKSKKNKEAESPKINIEPFNFYEIAKECNFFGLHPPPSVTDRTPKNADHSYHASNNNNVSKESPVVHIHRLQRPTDIPGTSKDSDESSAPTKDTLVNGGKKTNGVQELHDSSDVPMITEDLTKVLTLHEVPSVLCVKDADDEVDNNSHVSETLADLPDSNKDLESICRISSNNSDSDSNSQESTISTPDTNGDQPMESQNENQYFLVVDDSESQPDGTPLFSNSDQQMDIATQVLANYAEQNPHSRERMDDLIIENISDEETNENSTDAMQLSSGTAVNTSTQNETTPKTVPPSNDNRHPSNDNSEDIFREYYKDPLKNELYFQTPIKPEEIVQAVALYHQHPWPSHLLETGRKKPKIKLLCIDEHVPITI